jgi:uncharacterized protein with GYD domain
METTMAAYIMVGNYTKQGMDKIRGAPARIDTAREVIAGLGGSLQCWYLTMGRYDFVAIIEAPSDEVMARLALAIGSHGNISTETLRAFNEQEFLQIVSELPY